MSLATHGCQRSSPTDLHVLAIGDSLIERGGQPSGWLQEYAGFLAQAAHLRGTLANFGEDGATSSQILELVRTNAQAREAIAQADVIVFDSGINDFLMSRGRVPDGTCGGADGFGCLTTMVSDFASNWDAIINELRSLAPHAAFRTMDIYYSVVDADRTTSPEAFEHFVVSLAAMNEHIRMNAGANHIAVASVHDAFNGVDGTRDAYAQGLILSDAIHPTALGETLIARAFEASWTEGAPTRR